MSNDILYKNGKIYTVDDNNSWAQAVAVKGNKITFVGSNAEAENIEAEKIVDLEGKMMLPGFVEAHAHVTWAAVDVLFKANLWGGKSPEDYVAKIREFVEANPDLPVYEGGGWENPIFEKSGPSRKLLDEICSDKPMIMWSHDKHSVWVNSKVMELCNITKDTQVPAGNIIEREEDGTPKGTLREFAAIALIEHLRPVFSKENYKEAITWVQKHLAQYGITSIQDPVLDPAEESIPALTEMSRDGELICKIRGAYKTSENDSYKYFDKFVPMRDEADSHMFKMNQVKFFVDGVVEGKTAYLKEPYASDPDYTGDPIWETEHMKKFCTDVDKAGFEMHFHIIGDAANAQALDVLDAVQAANPREDRRPVFTHLQVVDPADHQRMVDHNVTAVLNPYWHFKYRGFFEDLEVPYLGERAYKEYPIRSLVDAGVRIGSASDYNVTAVPAPLRGVQIGYNRVDLDEDPEDKDLVLAPEESVAPEVLIRAFTMGNAYAAGIEDITGSIEAGKCADLIILEENIFDVPKTDIHKVKILQTISEGKVIYEA